MNAIPQRTRTARLEARISPDALAIVRRAAEMQGRSISDFVVSAAQDAAQRTIEDASIMRLSVDDQRAILNAVLNPPAPNNALKKALEANLRLITSSQ